MPYNIIKSGEGYKVEKGTTGETFSKKPLPKKRAIAQRQAIAISESQKKELEAHFKKHKHTAEQKKLMRKILRENPKLTIEQAHAQMMKMQK
jgi:hypothetical protein